MVSTPRYDRSKAAFRRHLGQSLLRADDEGQHVADRKKSKKSSMSPRFAVAMIRHCLRVSLFCRSRCSSVASSHGPAARSLRAATMTAKLRLGCASFRRTCASPAGAKWRTRVPAGSFACLACIISLGRLRLSAAICHAARTTGREPMTNAIESEQLTRRRSRHRDGRSDAAVLAARGEILGSRRRRRSIAADAAGREADRVPRPRGAASA